MANTTVLALFKNKRDADAAVRALQSAHFDSARLGVVSPAALHAPPAGKLAAAGGLLGLGLGMAAGGVIPGTHAVVPGGWFVPLIGAITGAATGAVAGLLISQSATRQHDLYYEEEVEAGRTLVSVDAEAGRANYARQILLQEGAFEASPIDTPHLKAS